MKPMPIRFFGCATLFMVGAWIGTGAHAQPTVSVASAPAQDARLYGIESAFTLAATRAGAAFVVEGEPYKKTLTPKEASGIVQTAAPNAFVEQIATAYDYEARLQKANNDTSVYVLKKRYTDPNDLPFVTLEEIRAATDEMGRLFAALDPFPAASRRPTHEPLQDFAVSLSDAQLAAMKDKTRGLRVQDLTPLQRDQLWHVPVYIFLQSTGKNLSKVGSELYGATDPSTLIGYSGSNEKPLFGYEGPSGSATQPRRFRLLSGTYAAIPNGVVVTSVNGVPVAEKPEPQAQTKPPQVGDAARKTEAPLSQSLREAVKQTNGRAGSASPTVVDAEMAAKPVWVVNGQAASPDVLMRAITDVYGLRLTTKVDGSRQISRVRPKVRSFADLKEALTQLLPDPFSRALQWREKSGFAPQMRALSDQLLSMGVFVDSAVAPSQIQALDVEARKKADALQTEFMVLKQQRAGVESRPADLRWAAVRALRTEVEPRLRMEGKEKVPVSSLSPAGQSALADALMMDVWAAVQFRIVNPVPNYVAHFEDGFVTGGYPDDKDDKGAFVPLANSAANGPKKKFTVNFYYRNAEGRLVGSGASFTTIFNGAK